MTYGNNCNIHCNVTTPTRSWWSALSSCPTTSATCPSQYSNKAKATTTFWSRSSRWWSCFYCLDGYYRIHYDPIMCSTKRLQCLWTGDGPRLFGFSPLFSLFQWSNRLETQSCSRGLERTLTSVIGISVIGFSPLAGLQVVGYLPICFAPCRWVSL